MREAIEGRGLARSVLGIVPAVQAMWSFQCLTERRIMLSVLIDSASTGLARPWKCTDADSHSGSGRSMRLEVSVFSPARMECEGKLLCMFVLAKHLDSGARLFRG